MKEFENGVAVITGGAQGIGAATAALAVERGHPVAVCDVDVEAAEVLCKQLGAPARPIPLDVRDAKSWEQSLEQIRHMIDVNLLGVILGLRAALPRLAQQGQALQAFARGAAEPFRRLALAELAKFPTKSPELQGMAGQRAAR